MLVENKINKLIEQEDYIKLEKDFKNHFNLMYKRDFDEFIDLIHKNKVDIDKFIEKANKLEHEGLHTIIALSKIK